MAVLLVTGGTGAIGRPLVDALIREPGIERLYLLVHADRPTRTDTRIRAVPGDVTGGPTLGLDAVEADSLASEITGIVHAAADTRFWPLLHRSSRTNVDGTSNMLAFARRCRRLDRVVALSTTHVAGRRTGRILETELDHDAGFVNAYESSKYDAERELRACSTELPVAVCRLSTVVGDSQSGGISRRGAIHHAVLLLYAGLTPMVPGREDSPVDLLALDYAVRSIAFLTVQGFDAGSVWHLCAGPDTMTAGEMLDLTLSCLVEFRPSWRRRAIERPAFVDLETFELFRRSVEEIGDSTMRAATDVVSHFAPQLAFPKLFDDSHCRAALAPSGLEPPPIRPVWRQVVRRLVTSGVDGCAAEVSE